jgi:hypothetical protein
MGSMRGRLQVGGSYILVVILISGFAHAMIAQDPFWSFMAMMGVFASLLPVALSKDPRNILPWWFVLLIALPSIEALIGASFTIHYVRLTTAASWVADILSMFMVSLGLLLSIRAYSSVQMNRPFLVGSTFFLFEVFIGAYCVIDYNFDRLWGTNHISSNADFMVYATASMIGALVLTLLLNYYLRIYDLNEFQRHAVGEGVTR